MSSQSEENLRLEIAHVLFVDIVGYSMLPMDEQVQALKILYSIVRETEEHGRAAQRDRLIRLPTGDGMALVFFGDAEAALRCAREISRALLRVPGPKLRMGVHSGPVYRIPDINTNLNVAGGGINMAQRVMDCGDAGHVLISKTVAENLGQVSSWAEAIHDLGEINVKHGVRLHIYNVYDEDFGNPEPPAKFGDKKLVVRRVPGEEAQHAAHIESPRARVALLCGRELQPDEYVLTTLESGLVKNGYEVFVPSRLPVGLEQADEIGRQLCAADFVISLLSAASSDGEALLCEAQIAHEASKRQSGRPRLLSVRVNFEGDLPAALGGLLASKQCSRWNAPEDDGRLLSEIDECLRSPAPVEAEPKGAQPLLSAAPPDWHLYIERPADVEFLDAVRHRDGLVLVKGVRQVGKTSLLTRGVVLAREEGLNVATTDLRQLDESLLGSAESFFRALGAMLHAQLKLEVRLEDVWNPRRSAGANFERYVRQGVLKTDGQPLVWVLDEVDRVLVSELGGEVLGLFRSWYDERASELHSVWSNLTMVMAYVAEPQLFIADPNKSPFNVGTKLGLRDFSFEQVVELNRRYGSPMQRESDVERYHALLNGHPYLTGRGLHEMKNRNLSLPALEDSAARAEGLFGDHLRYVLTFLSYTPALADAARACVRGWPLPNDEVFYRLRSAGLVCGDSARDAAPRCKLYADFLRRHLT